MPPAEAFGPLLFVDTALILCQSLAFSCSHEEYLSFCSSPLSPSAEVARGDGGTHGITRGVMKERVAREIRTRREQNE